MKSRKATPGQPPGWYPDPDGSGELVYFDGAAWTDAKVASYSNSDTGLPHTTASPVAPASSASRRLPRRPPAALRPLYLYAGAALGLVQWGGRVSRSQYGIFLAVNAALVALAIYLPVSIGWIAVAVFVLTTLIVSIPRLHDVGASGAQLVWLPALALPLIGWLQGLRLLRKLFSAGHLGSNKYGPTPL